MIKDKKIIVFGLGVTGISSIKALSSLGAKVFVYDDSKKEELLEKLKQVSEFDFEIIEDIKTLDFKDFYCVVKSPGIRLDNNFVKLAIENNLEVISDIELAYRIWGGENIIAITGTNGKTTTTSLVSHILNNAGIKSKVVGNIGVGILWEMFENRQDYKYVLELSSFQLSSIKKFKPKISLITNISKDHIDWHGSYENYIEAKYNIFKNQDSSSLLILNKDDDELNKIKLKNIKIKYFSIKEEVDAFLYDKKLIIKFNNSEIKIDRNDINLVGNHNISNVLAASLIALEFNITKENLIKALKTFKSIEHRIEFVKEIKNVKYYNDSKGTNVDSTKVALDGFDSNVILIAGGYDKNSEFDELFEKNSNIKNLILFGQTKEKIKSSAEKYIKAKIDLVENLEEAVILANQKANSGDVVLFSPACASWDMYKNFEERGNHFKKIVNNI